MVRGSGYKEASTCGLAVTMSRAFVKESDEDLAAGELPERPLGAHANYVTPAGLVLRELAEDTTLDAVEAVTSAAFTVAEPLGRF